MDEEIDPQCSSVKNESLSYKNRNKILITCQFVFVIAPFWIPGMHHFDTGDSLYSKKVIE
jgi:hypothetical protein